MTKDSLGDRMKLLEGRESARTLMPMLPVMARLDGRSFSRLTRNLKRPYDRPFMTAMQSTAEYLAKETNSLLTYTQSDEITLVWQQPDSRTELLFGGRVQKLVSVLASMAGIRLYQMLTLHEVLASMQQLPMFDCRVWSLPRESDASAAFLWRELDATRNSIQMAAQAKFSHKQLHERNCSELQDMLMSVGVNWNNYPADFKRGQFIQRRHVERKFTTEELDRLPPQHAARENPDLVVRRCEYVYLSMPPFSQVINRDDVVFRGADPLTAQAAAAEATNVG